jgi:hypothetical protein
VFEGTTSRTKRRERKLDGELRMVRVTLFPDREVSGRVGARSRYGTTSKTTFA